MRAAPNPRAMLLFLIEWRAGLRIFKALAAGCPRPGAGERAALHMLEHLHYMTERLFSDYHQLAGKFNDSDLLPRQTDGLEGFVHLNCVVPARNPMNR